MPDDQATNVSPRKKKKSGRVCTECGERSPPTKKRSICDECIAKLAEAVKTEEKTK